METQAEVTNAIEAPQDVIAEDLRRGIGGSEAAAVLGIDSNRTPLQLYLEKRGEIERPDLSENENVYWGTRLEDIIADEYTIRTGRKIRRVNRKIIHEKYPWMIAHIDREVLNVRPRRGLEVKNTNVFRFGKEFGDAGTDEVPYEHVAQCAHYMAVTGWEVWDLAVLVGGNRWQLYEIERNPELIEIIEDREAAFWECVLDGTPPEFDPTHPTALDLVRQIYPGTDGSTVALDGSLEEVADRYIEVGKTIRALEKERDALKAALLAAIGEASVATLSDGSYFTRKEVERNGYTVAPKTYVDFRFHKAKSA